MADERPDRRIMVNPCNKAAERNNLSAIQDAFNDIYIRLGDVINNENVVNNYNSGGDDVFRFVITGDLSTTGATAQNIDTGESMSVIDWTSRNIFGCSFAVGHQGWAVRKPPAEDGTPSSEAWIVTLDGYARWVIATLDESLADGTAQATVDAYWGGPTNKAVPPSSIIVNDELGIGTHLDTSDQVMCVLDDVVGCRYILVSCIPNTNNSVNSRLIQITGTSCEATAADGNCLYTGTLLTASSGTGSACGLSYSSAGTVWVVDARSCNPKLVLGNERYIGVKIADAWNNGGTTRQLWAIVSDREPRTVLVKWNKASSGDDYVDSVGACTYNGFIVQLNAADPCTYDVVESCWIASDVPSGCRIEEGAISVGFIQKLEHEVSGSTRKLVVAQPARFLCRSVLATAESTGTFAPGDDDVGITAIMELPFKPRSLPWDLDGDNPSEASNDYGLAGEPGTKLLLVWDDDLEKPIIAQAEHVELEVVTSVSDGGPCKLRHETARIATMVISRSTSKFIDISRAICECVCEEDPPYEPPVDGGGCGCPTPGVSSVQFRYDWIGVHSLVNSTDAGGDPVVVLSDPITNFSTITLEWDADGRSWNKDVTNTPKPGWYGEIDSGLVNIPGLLYSVEYDGGNDGYAIYECNHPSSPWLHLFNFDGELIATNLLGAASGRDVQLVPPGAVGLGDCQKTSRCRFKYGVFMECTEDEAGNQSISMQIARIVPDAGDPARPEKAPGDLIGDVRSIGFIVRSECREVTGSFVQDFGQDAVDDYHSFKGYAFSRSCPQDTSRVLPVVLTWDFGA